jgi:hypothetical protein
MRLRAMQIIPRGYVLGAEEIMIVIITYDHQERLDSYRLLAKAFGLTPHRTCSDPAVLRGKCYGATVGAVQGAPESVELSPMCVAIYRKT